jgi:hypothetical protein
MNNMRGIGTILILLACFLPVCAGDKNDKKTSLRATRGSS